MKYLQNWRIQNVYSPLSPLTRTIPPIKLCIERENIVKHKFPHVKILMGINYTTNSIIGGIRFYLLIDLLFHNRIV